MDGKQTRYIYEQKVAAASAVVDGGMSGRDAMEALRPKPRGRPKGSGPRPRERTREQELEERCRRLETEVAYLKKLRALVERDGLRPG